MQNTTFDKGHIFFDRNGARLTVIDIDDRAKPGTRILLLESAADGRIFPCPNWMAQWNLDNGHWTTL